MSITTRVNKLEQEVSRHKKVVSCFGIKYIDGTVDEQSEKNYQAYLQSNRQGPFIWISFMRQRIKDETTETP